MKRSFILATSFAILVGLPASALDFGLTIENVSALNATGSSAFSQVQENQAIAWLSLPVGSFSSIYASVVYEFSGTFYYQPDQPAALRPWSITAGRVEWEGFLPLGTGSSLGWSLGRVPFSDYSGRVVSGLLDGAKAVVSLGSVQLSAAVAYTGLTFKDDARIAIDADDEARLASTEQGWPGEFAPQRLLASLGVRANELLPLHDFGLDAWAQFDLEAQGVATHTQYLEPFIEGRAGRSFRWRLWGVAELGQDPSFFYAMAAGARLRYSLPEALGLRVAASGNWASGDYDADGPMRAFKPIRAGTVATIATTAFTDALGCALDVSISPLRGLSVGAGGAAIFKPGDAVPYRGAEAQARVAYKPVSDVALSLSGGAFFPNASAGSSDVEWTAALKATLSI